MACGTANAHMPTAGMPSGGGHAGSQGGSHGGSHAGSRAGSVPASAAPSRGATPLSATQAIRGMAHSHSLKRFDREAHTGLADTSGSSYNFRRAVGVDRLAPQWVSAGGAGGYHFPARPDRHQHGLQEHRHQMSEETKWKNRHELRAQQ